jgi:two-component system OmpR family response regulator
MAQLDSTRPSPAPTVPPPNLAPVVLIADNEPTLLELFRETLEDDQLRVLTARNGQDALALAETWIPDVLVTDVVMPRLDGFGLICAVRRLYPGIPVIIMTGDATYQDRPIEHLAADVGAVATFMKPFDLTALHQAVRSAVSLLAPAALQESGVNGRGESRAA